MFDRFSFDPCEMSPTLLAERRDSTSKPRVRNALLFLISLWFAAAPTAQPVRCEQAAAPRSQGPLRYRVYYLGMRVGDLSFSARDSISPTGEELRIVHVRMKTRSVASALFPIENDYRVVYNRRRLDLVRVVKRIRQKNVAGEWKLTYHNGEVALQIQGDQAPAETRYWSVTPPVLEVISVLDLLTRIRCTDSTLTVRIDEEGVPMEAKVRVFRTSVARFATAVFRPEGKARRTWSTDILTNRFSKPGAMLKVEFGQSYPELPVVIRYSLGASMATAKLIRE